MRFAKLHNYREGPEAHVGADVVQCTAETTILQDLRRRGYLIERYKKLRPHMDPMKCQRGASVTVNGNPMCKLHAGQVALKEILK